MQLHMILSDVTPDQIPTWQAPPGYCLRRYQPGDEDGILRVLDAAGFDDWDAGRLGEYLEAPERSTGTHVVTNEAAIVAVTFASQDMPIRGVGRLDFVAADPDHQGRGLGLGLCGAVTRTLLERGYVSVALSTDDWRLGAIKTYLKLGFVPKVIRQDMPDRWRAIFEQLQWPYEADWLDYRATRLGPEREGPREQETPMHTIDLEGYQALFSSVDPLIWLAHAGVSPIPRPVAEAIEARTRDVLKHAAAHAEEWVADVKEVKQLASLLLNCDAADLAITPNTTHGINIIAHGMRWRPGDQVILASKEYPANVYPWWAQQTRGVELVWVDPDRDGRIPAESYEAKITDRTRVLTVSHVQFASGYRHDLERLGQICEQAGIVLLVDAIQSFSVFPIDVAAWGIDALSTGVHKWLCGPTGVALFYTTPKLRDELAFTWVGADSVVDASNYLDYDFELLDDARRFENAMLNYPGIAGVRAALEVVHAFGRERIEAQIHKATDRIVAVLSHSGFDVHSPRTGDEWSGIVSASHPKIESDTLAGRLKQDGIVTTVRDGRLRFAPHAYHTETQFERVTEVLKKCVDP